MTKQLFSRLILSALALTAAFAACTQAQQTQQNVNPADPGTSELAPPPAYTAKPKDEPPAPDTDAQLAAMARFKARAEEKFAAEHKAYNDQVTPAYNFHYGKGNPYVPGNIAPVGEGFMQPGAYPSAEYCGTCHQEAYSQWRQALHSNSFRTPFYRTSVNLLIRDNTRGIAFRALLR